MTVHPCASRHCHCEIKSQADACLRCRETTHRIHETEKCKAYVDAEDVVIIKSQKFPMCNYFPCQVRLYSQAFPSSEHAYQWRLLVVVMREILYAKADCYSQFKIALLDSSMKHIVEAVQGDIFWLLLCLPTPLTLVCGESPIIPLLVHQPTYLSIWPAIPSLQRGLATNPRVTGWCICGCSWRDGVCHVCGCCRRGIVAMDVIWRRLCVGMM